MKCLSPMESPGTLVAISVRETSSYILKEDAGHLHWLLSRLRAFAVSLFMFVITPFILTAKVAAFFFYLAKSVVVCNFQKTPLTETLKAIYGHFLRLLMLPFIAIISLGPTKYLWTKLNDALPPVKLPRRTSDEAAKLAAAAQSLASLDDLTKRHQALIQEKGRVDDDIQSLRKQYDTLQTQYQALTNPPASGSSGTGPDRDLLQREVDSLRGQMQQLREEHSRALQDAERQCNEALQKQFTEYKTQYEALQQQLKATKSAAPVDPHLVGTLQEKIRTLTEENQRVQTDLTQRHQFAMEQLRNVQGEEIRKAVDAATLKLREDHTREMTAVREEHTGNLDKARQSYQTQYESLQQQLRDAQALASAGSTSGDQTAAFQAEIKALTDKHAAQERASMEAYEHTMQTLRTTHADEIKRAVKDASDALRKDFATQYQDIERQKSELELQIRSLEKRPDEDTVRRTSDQHTTKLREATTRHEEAMHKATTEHTAAVADLKKRLEAALSALEAPKGQVDDASNQERITAIRKEYTDRESALNKAHQDELRALRETQQRETTQLQKTFAEERDQLTGQVTLLSKRPNITQEAFDKGKGEFEALNLHLQRLIREQELLVTQHKEAMTTLETRLNTAHEERLRAREEQLTQEIQSKERAHQTQLSSLQEQLQSLQLTHETDTATMEALRAEIRTLEKAKTDELRDLCSRHEQEKGNLIREHERKLAETQAAMAEAERGLREAFEADKRSLNEAHAKELQDLRAENTRIFTDGMQQKEDALKLLQVQLHDQRETSRSEIKKIADQMAELRVQLQEATARLNDVQVAAEKEQGKLRAALASMQAERDRLLEKNPAQKSHEERITALTEENAALLEETRQAKSEIEELAAFVKEQNQLYQQLKKANEVLHFETKNQRAVFEALGELRVTQPIDTNRYIDKIYSILNELYGLLPKELEGTNEEAMTHIRNFLFTLLWNKNEFLFRGQLMRQATEALGPHKLEQEQQQGLRVHLEQKKDDVNRASRINHTEPKRTFLSLLDSIPEVQGEDEQASKPKLKLEQAVGGLFDEIERMHVEEAEATVTYHFIRQAIATTPKPSPEEVDHLREARTALERTLQEQEIAKRRLQERAERAEAETAKLHTQLRHHEELSAKLAVLEARDTAVQDYLRTKTKGKWDTHRPALENIFTTRPLSDAASSSHS